MGIDPKNELELNSRRFTLLNKICVAN
jgi:hypothetical protein